MMSPLLTLLLTAVAILPSIYCAQDPVNLRTAGNYVILAQSGITTTGTPASEITGDIAVSPAAATSITGFGLKLARTHSNSRLVTGKVYAADYKSPTPAKLTQAIKDEIRAYNDAAGRKNPDYLNMDINGPQTIPEGLYKWTAPLTLGGKIIFEGDADSVFIFQIAGTLTFERDCKIVLRGGVLAKNIFYQASGAVTLATGSKVQGIILGKTGIVFKSGAKLVTGRALAQTAVTLTSNTLTAPPDDVSSEMENTNDMSEDINQGWQGNFE